MGGKGTFLTGCQGVRTLSGKIPVFDVFLALNYAHPVLGGLCEVSSKAGTKHLIVVHDEYMDRKGQCQG